MLFGIVLAFFLLTASLIPHLQLGLYDKYLKQHGGVFTLSLLAVLLMGSVGAYRLVSDATDVGVSRLLGFSQPATCHVATFVQVL